jgi:hypothetical protein
VLSTIHIKKTGDTMSHRLRTRSVRALALAVLLSGAAATVAAPGAHAGNWVHVTCANPDGSVAPTEGWTGYPKGAGAVGTTNTACGQGLLMGAIVGWNQPAPANASQVVQYTPPDGSALVGGTAFVGLTADGYGDNAQGVAAVLTPNLDFTPGNVLVVCAAKSAPCQNNTNNFYGAVELSAARGGSLYLMAGCTGATGAKCNSGGSHGAWAAATLAWANLMLSTTGLPTATDFRGGLLDASAHGTAGLAFTATDPGPGVYKVIVTIDNKVIYDATPNTNGGKCVPVGTRNGWLMWQWQQPCPRSQTVDLTVKTTNLTDGAHELKVVIRNAALDTTTALRQTIVTNNRTTVSSRLTSDAPATPVGALAPVYAVALDPATQALIGGVRRLWGRSAVTLSGTLSSTAGVPAPGVLVTLFAQTGGQGEQQAVARTSTDASGHWILAAPQGASRILTISYGESPDPASALAIKIRETVKPDVSLNVRALGRGRLRFSGRLRINPLGSPRPLVVIQTRNRQRRWRALGASLRVSASGAYSIIYNGGPDVIGGSYAFRTVAHATSLFATGVSPIRRVRVR